LKKKIHTDRRLQVSRFPIRASPFRHRFRYFSRVPYK